MFQKWLAHRIIFALRSFRCTPLGCALAYGVRKKFLPLLPGTYSSARFARLGAVPGLFQSRLTALAELKHMFVALTRKWAPKDDRDNMLASCQVLVASCSYYDWAMGLDLIVEGCAKPGHERDWRELLERSFADEELSDAEVKHFQDICIPAYERIGAPRVGYDDAANEWILTARKPKTLEEAEAILKEFHGHYALRLVKCDGVPQHSNGGAYEGADETSFRGAFLDDCKDVLSKDLLLEAWGHKFPEEAVAYGKALLVAADAAEAAGKKPKVHHTFLSRFGLSKAPEAVPIEEQLEIVREAGRWFIFWGERGHAIRAWF